jgi:DNA-binding HxlR family transcriptional regulator
MGSPPQARGTTSGRPIMVLFDLLSRRWAMRILWELRSEALSFRALRGAADDISPSVLQARVNELRSAKLIASSDNGYVLTVLGRELLQKLLPLHGFAEAWAEQGALEALGIRRDGSGSKSD